MKMKKLIAILLVLALIAADMAVIAEGILTLPKALKVIEEEAFYGASGISKVVVPEGTTEIRARAFAESSLTEIEVPASVEYIADDAFDGCEELVFSADKGSYAYNWAVEHRLIVPPIAVAPENDFEYEINPDNTATVTGYVGNGGNVIMPETFGGYVISRIGDKAFSDCSRLTGIVIPGSVTYIGNYAFMGCSSLTSIVLPDNSLTIGNGIFWECVSLSNVTLPRDITSLPYATFYNCSSLTEIDIPDSVTSIGGAVFYGCSSLTSIIIPDRVTSLSHSVFYHCSNLIEVSLPDSVTTLGSYIFSGCKSLASIDLPNNLLSIGECAFTHCYALTDIRIPSGVTSIPNYAFGQSHLKSISLPDSIVSIGVGAFSNCNNLMDITLPGILASIGEEAFKGCTVISMLTIPENVNTIGKNAFAGCSSLTLQVYQDSYAHRWCEEAQIICTFVSGTVTPTPTNEPTPSPTPESTPEPEFEIFCMSDELCEIVAYNGTDTEVEIPAEISGRSVIAIDGLAFRGNENIISISVPDTVTSFDSYTFAGCSGLKSVKLSTALTSIPSCLFQDCISLEVIEIPENVREIDKSAFDDCAALTEIVLPDTLGYIAGSAFRNCISLDAIEIPDGVYYIGDSVFAGCSTLAEIDLPDSLTEISQSLFYGCDQLSTVQIPESVTTIGRNAFNYCNSLVQVELPLSLKELNSFAFFGCASLESVAIPSGIEEIQRYTFYDCDSLSRIILPDSLNRIEDYAFACCDSLEQLRLTNGLSVIGANAFYACKSLREINIPDSVREIKGNAFLSCEGLSELALPASISYIDATAFDRCGQLCLMVDYGSYAHDWCEEYFDEYVFTPGTEPTPEPTIAPSYRISKLRCSVESGINVGENVFWTVETSDAEGEERYSFSLYCDDELLVQQSESPANYFYHTLDRAGTYRLEVSCNDAGGTVAGPASHEIKVIEAPVRIVSVNAAKGVNLCGEMISWNVAVEKGGMPIMYSYELIHNGESIAVNRDTSESRFSWTADAAGSYVLYVSCTDVNGFTDETQSDEIWVYSAEEAHPAAPVLVYEEGETPLGSNVENAPEINTERILLHWNAVANADDYSVNLDMEEGGEWVSVIAEDHVSKAEYTLGIGLFTGLTENTLFRAELKAHGLMDSAASIYYFRVVPRVVSDVLTVNGQSALSWNQSSRFASSRDFSVASDLEWTASCDADWIKLSSTESILTVRMAELDGQQERTALINVSNGINTVSIAVCQDIADEAPNLTEPKVFSMDSAKPSEYPFGEFMLRWNMDEHELVRVRISQQQADGSFSMLYEDITSYEKSHFSENRLGKEIHAGEVYAIELAGVYDYSYAACEIEEDLLKNIYYVRMSEEGHSILVNGEQDITYSIIETAGCYISASNYFSCSTDAAWLSVNKNHVYEHGSHLSISAETNFTGETRTGHVYFQCGSATASVTVVQENMSLEILHPGNLSKDESNPTKLYMDLNLVDINYFYFIYRGTNLYIERYKDGAYGEIERITPINGFGMHEAVIETSDVSGTSHCRLTVAYGEHAQCYYVSFRSAQDKYYDSFFEHYRQLNEGAHKHVITVYPDTMGGWRVSSNATWLKPSVRVGISGNAPFTVEIEANTSGMPRTGRLTFVSTADESVRWLDIHQEADNYFAIYYENPETGIFELYDPANYSLQILDGSGTDTTKFRVYAADNLRVNSNEEWITSTNTRPESGDTFKLKTSVNPAENGVRMGTVTVTDGSNSATITLTQAPNLDDVALFSPNLSISSSNPSVTKYDDLDIVWTSVKNAVRYEIRVSDGRTKRFVASVDEDGSTQYSCRILKEYLAPFTRNILFIRAYDQYGFQCNDNFYFIPTPGDSVLINGSTQVKWENASDTAVSKDYVVQSSAAWTASASESWISLSATSGSSGDTLTINLAENTAFSPRSGQVVLLVNGQNCIISITQCAYLAERYPSLNAPLYSQDKARPTIVQDTNSLTLSWFPEPQAIFYEFDIYSQVSTNTKRLVAESDRIDPDEGSYTFTDLALEAGELYSITFRRRSQRWNDSAREYYFMLDDADAWVCIDGESGLGLEMDGDEGSEYLKITSSGYWSAHTEDDWILLHKKPIGQAELDENGYVSSRYSSYSNISGESLCISLLANIGSAPRRGSVTVTCGSAVAVIDVYQYQEYEIAGLTSPYLATKSKETTNVAYSPLTLRWNAATGGTGRYMISLRESERPGTGYSKVLEEEKLTSLSYTIPVSELKEGMYYRLYLGTEIAQDDYSGESYYFYVNYEHALTPLPFVDWSDAQVGGMVKINASANGGAGDYMYAYELLYEGEKQYITTWENMTYYTFPITKDGTYQVRLYVKDATDAQKTVLSDSYSTSQGISYSYIQLSQNQWSVSNQGASMKVSVSANMDWTASKSDAWIGLEASRGAASITVSKNESYAERTGRVIFTAGSKTAVLTIVQAAAEEVTGETQPLTLSESVWNILSPVSSSMRLTVEAFDIWKVQNVPDWITLSKTSDNGTSSLNIYASENTGLTRSATLSFSTEVSSKKLHVVQAGSDVAAQVTNITVSNSKPVTGETVVFEVTTKNADEIMFMVDNECYEVLSVLDDHVSFARSFSMAVEGEPRIVRFVPYQKGIQGIISDPLEVDVYSHGKLASAQLDTIDKEVLGAGISLSWSAVPNAESYTVYLLRDGKEIYKNAGITTTSLHIPSQIVDREGSYVVILMALAHGFTQSQTSMIVDVVIPQASFSIVSPANGAVLMSDTEVDFVIDNPDGYNVALRITDKNGKTSYLPENYGTCADKYIQDKFRFVPESSGTFTAMVMGWPTETRTPVADSWYDTDKAIRFTVEGPVAKDFIVGNGAANQFTTSVKQLALRTNTVVRRVEFYLDDVLLSVYHNGKEVTELTSWDSEVNGIRTFSCSIPSPKEGLRRYKARVYSAEGEYSERTFTFYAITPVTQEICYPVNYDTRFSLIPYASESESTILKLSDRLVVKGSYGDLAFVQFGGQNGFVPKDELSARQIVDWNELTLETAHRVNDFYSYVGSGTVIPLAWTSNAVLSDSGEYRIYKRLEGSTNWTLVASTKATQASVPVDTLGAGKWRIKVSLCAGADEYLSSEYSCLFNISATASDYLLYMVETNENGLDYDYFMRSVMLDSELLLNVHKNFTTGWSKDGVYVSPINVEALTENSVAQFYSTVFGDTYDELHAGDELAKIYMIDGLMESLADEAGISANEFGSTVSEALPIIKTCLQGLGVSADLVTSLIEHLEAKTPEDYRISWDDLYDILKGEIKKNSAWENVMEGLSFAPAITDSVASIVTAILKYCRYSQISPEAIEEVALILEKSNDPYIKEIAGSLRNMSDANYCLAYCSGTCGFSILYVGAGFARDTVIDLLLSFPLLAGAKNFAVFFNTMVINVDEIQQRGYELSWAIDAAEAYRPTYEAAVLNFKADPLKCYAEYVKKMETFMRLVSLEWSAWAAFGDAMDKSWWGNIKAAIQGYDVFKTIAPRVETMMSDIQASCMSSMDDFYFNCLSNFGISYVAMKDIVN